MCTLVVAAQVFEDHPLVVVANRDEQWGRASLPPSMWPGGSNCASGPRPASPDLRFLAPKDLVAGGTWLGINAAGVFVGITNRFLGPKDPDRVSRGVLVAEALAMSSARAIHEAMSKVPPA